MRTPTERNPWAKGRRARRGIAQWRRPANLKWMVAPSWTVGSGADETGRHVTGFMRLVRADHRDGTDKGAVAGISKRPEGLYLVMIAALPR